MSMLFLRVKILLSSHAKLHKVYDKLMMVLVLALEQIKKKEV